MGAKPDRRWRARPDDPERRGRRAAPRAQIALPATMDAICGFRHIDLLDISIDGASIGGTNLPAVGSDLVLRCGDMDAFGLVVWAAPGRCGLHFDEPISAGQLAALRQVADADRLSGMSHAERQAADDWRSGFAR